MIIKKSYDENPKVYLISSPIGNIDDITLRSLKTIKELEVLFSEDTRVTKKLLTLLEIHDKKLISFNDQNEEERIALILKYLESGKSVGIISDQGTPLMSDPGYKLVATLRKYPYSVVSLPGATAIIPAISMSTLPPYPFLFFGFLKGNKTNQKNKLLQLKDLPYSMVFFVSLFELIDILKLFLEVFNNREIAVIREISKVYEETIIGNLNEVIEYLTKNQKKGEFVVVLAGRNSELKFDLSITSHIEMYLKEGLSKKDAMKKVAKDLQIPKSEVYKRDLLERDKCI